MSPGVVRAWVCGVCGYVHRGTGAPDECPICGASREEFEPYSEPDLSAGPAANSWRCSICGHVHAGSAPPDECPVCGTLGEQFESVAAAEVDSRLGRKARVAVVGGGIAGLAAVEAARAASPDAELTLVSREPGLPYYRLNLTRYLAGEIERAALPVYPEEWYAERRIRVLSGVDVVGLGLGERAVELRGGPETRLPFDRLVFAGGAHPFVPPIPGAELDGVTTLRTLADADEILSRSLDGASVVCVGGGILGLEAAGALSRRGSRVTVLEGYGWLLPRQLNQRAGELLGSRVAGLGVELRPHARTAQLVGEGRVRGVRLEDGSTLPADLVVVATGVRPNSALARQAGLRVDQGVVVDDYLGTSDPDVLAAGDVAEHRGITYGLWTAAKAQGSIAGMNAVGLRVEFGGIPRSNTLKVLGIDLFSIGRVEPDDASYVVVEGEVSDAYYRFLFRDSRLVGAILLGDLGLAARVKRAIEAGTDFSGLLGSRPAAMDLLDHIWSR